MGGGGEEGKTLGQNLGGKCKSTNKNAQSNLLLESRPQQMQSRLMVTLSQQNSYCFRDSINMPMYTLSMCGIRIMQSKKIIPIKTE